VSELLIPVEVPLAAFATVGVSRRCAAASTHTQKFLILLLLQKMRWPAYLKPVNGSIQTKEEQRDMKMSRIMDKVHRSASRARLGRALAATASAVGPDAGGRQDSRTPDLCIMAGDNQLR
jgi:hypothetical protein